MKRTEHAAGEAVEAPKYQQLARVEARLWPQQQDELRQVRRAVLAQRTVKDERITDNTLLRVAVDLLLAHAEELAGDTEEELRASVLPPSSGHRRGAD